MKKVEEDKAGGQERLNIRILAVDMDGMALNKRSRISPQTMEAFRKLCDAGIIFVPTTGRALSCLPWQLAERQDLYRYVISSNGAQVTDCRKMESIFNVPMKKEASLELLHRCRNERLGVTAHISQEYLMQGRMLLLVGRLIYGRDAKKTLYVKDMLETVKTCNGILEELQFYFLSRQAENHVRQMMEDFPDFSAAYDRTYVEIFSESASKGKALAELAAFLGISCEQIACIGDGENDLSMFRASGLRFAMGNAVQALKDEADIILPSNREDGIAYAVRHYLTE